MKQSIIERIAGVSLLLGGLMGVVAHIIHPSAPESAQALHHYVHATVGAHLLLGSAVLLVCLGLPALSARMGRAGGVAAFAAYPLLFFGLMSAEFLHCPVEIALFPELETLGHEQMTRIVMHMFSGASVYGRVQSISLPLLLAGVVSLLLAIRKKELPKWPAVFLIGFLAFLAATFVPIPHGFPAGRLFAVNLYLAFAAYGFVLMTVSSSSSAQTTAEMRAVQRETPHRVACNAADLCVSILAQRDAN